VTVEGARLALRELGKLHSQVLRTMQACSAVGLDAGPLGSVLSEVDRYRREAAELLGWPPPRR
jgi:hypothetical protein